ncbi:hypothetical protein [Helicobacter sp. 23-1045]
MIRFCVRFCEVCANRTKIAESAPISSLRDSAFLRVRFCDFAVYIKFLQEFSHKSLFF